MLQRELVGRHRMPLVFGPTAGPRQGADGETYDYGNAPRDTVTISFLTDCEPLERLMPPCCQLDGDPVVTVEHVELREIEWLAGRSYRILGIKYPVLYRGPDEAARGPFLSVLWENLAEPIISGREELGFAKLYCELPPPRILRGAYHYTAVWDGHEFVRLTLRDFIDADPSKAAAVDGVLHHRYLPRVARTGETEVEQMVITPAGGVAARYESFQRATGTVEFVRSSWEQLPTMFHIVNILADLPIREYRGATIAKTRGTKDLSDQRILR